MTIMKNCIFLAESGWSSMLQGKNTDSQIHNALKCLYAPAQCFDKQRKSIICSTTQFWAEELGSLTVSNYLEDSLSAEYF